MQLKLKSKIVNGCSFDSIDISAYVIPLKTDEARYERDLKKFCRAFSKKVQADDIAKDDMATLRCESKHPKFQKEAITVRVGLGLYSKELEEGLIGMKVGERRELTVGPDPVTVTVLLSERQIIPPLTDELARNCGNPDITNADDAREFCRFKQYDEILDDRFDDTYSYFTQELLNRSEFSFEEEEMAAAITTAKKSMSQDAQENLKDSDNDLDFEGFAQKLGRSMLIAALFGQEMAQLSQSDYDEYLKKTALAAECCVDEVREAEPLNEYLIFTYSDIFIEKTEKYVLNRLKREGEHMQ